MSKPTNLRYNEAMMNQEQQQVIALAATVQALSSVQEIAIKGRFNEDNALPLFRSLTTYSPDSVLQAFGNDKSSLTHGISQLKHLFSDQLDRDLVQYLLAVLSIELKLVRSPQMRSILQTELQSLSSEISHPDADNNDNFAAMFEDDEEDGDNTEDSRSELTVEQYNDRLLSADSIAKFADIYKQTASQIEPRIMIKGNHQYLQSETSANQIRALLLAALRGAAFFRHYDGRRVDLMFKRSRYVEIINDL